MTSPAAIAQRLTPAQVRALKDPQGCDHVDWQHLCNFEWNNSSTMTTRENFAWRCNPLGLAVLTELERIERGL